VEKKKEDLRHGIKSNKVPPIFVASWRACKVFSAIATYGSFLRKNIDAICNFYNDFSCHTFFWRAWVMVSVKEVERTAVGAAKNLPVIRANFEARGALRAARADGKPLLQ
jgi:hypothetical protein